MATNKKKISDLPVWGGDKEMRLHAHKPGVSQAVSIAEILAAVPATVEPGGGALPTGAVVLMPVGTYEDYLECSGAVVADASAPELAQILKSGGQGQKYAGYIADSEVRSTVGTSTEISHAVRHKGYTFYKTPTAGNLIVAVDATGNVAFTGTIAASGDLYATENAVYFVSSNSLYSITVVDGVFKSQYTGESASSFGGVATVSETEDLYIQATGVARLFNPIAKTSRAVSYANGASLSGTYTGLIGCAGGRIFAASTINTVPGLYEFKYDQVTGLLSADLVVHASPAFNILVAAVESSCVYFGTNGIQFRLDAVSGNVSRVHAPVFASYSASVFKSYALDDFVFFTTNSGSNLAYMSFDGGRNWVGAPGFNAKLSLVLIDESTGELVVAGSAGSQGSVNGGTGNIQRNLLKMLAADQFVLPKISAIADGYRFYVKNKIHYARNGFVVGVGEIPGSPNFVEVDGDEVLAALNAGKSASVIDGQVVITESRAEKWSEIRGARDLLLAESDVEILKINDLEAINGHVDVELRQSLAQYRQDLRDLTTQSDPFDITWPTWSSI